MIIRSGVIAVGRSRGTGDYAKEGCGSVTSAAGSLATAGPILTRIAAENAVRCVGYAAGCAMIVGRSQSVRMMTD